MHGRKAWLSSMSLLLSRLNKSNFWNFSLQVMFLTSISLQNMRVPAARELPPFRHLWLWVPKYIFLCLPGLNITSLDFWQFLHFSKKTWILIFSGLSENSLSWQHHMLILYRYCAVCQWVVFNSRDISCTQQIPLLHLQAVDSEYFLSIFWVFFTSSPTPAFQWSHSGLGLRSSVCW